jgi:hypothetical protein
VLRVGPYQFYFYSHDLIREASHVHVDRDELSAKFCLNPVALARNQCGRFRPEKVLVVQPDSPRKPVVLRWRG